MAMRCVALVARSGRLARRELCEKAALAATQNKAAAGRDGHTRTLAAVRVDGGLPWCERVAWA